MPDVEMIAPGMNQAIPPPQPQAIEHKRKRSISESSDNPAPHVSPCLPPDDPVQKPVADSDENLWTDCLELTDQEIDCAEEDLHLWADTDETHKLEDEFEFELPPYNSYEELFCANYLAEN